ncbi:uncharacterized protein J4E92_002218 [Alternaria infectoria]|uniref:uncharacterized protein n=1 Tax=Alternaria infectoria TaxID=45303 RepID=UPI00222093FA|nr:uncharacterized protein J4E92_002218 [Alternaria infectoria]KAI4937487.1 hypothetical protein J4E92_002218 [Alternaria infectoria]
MEITVAALEGQVCDDLKKHTMGFDYLDLQTGAIITGELDGLKKLFNALSPALQKVTSIKAALWLTQMTQNCISQGHTPPKLIGDKPLSQAEWKIYQDALPECTCHQATGLGIDELRDELAAQVLVTLESFWTNRPTDIEELRAVKQKLANLMTVLLKSEAKAKAFEAALSDEKRKVEELELSLKMDEGSFAAKERILNDKYRQLSKGYYTNVEKLVKERVYDEGMKHIDSGHKVHVMALQHARMLKEKEVLEAKMLEGDQEKVLLRRTKLELEREYRKRDDQANALQQGYDQLNNENQVLQTEKAVLQTDYDELKREYEKLSREPTSGPMPHHESQPAVSKPHIPDTAAVFARQVAELQHLDGLATIWQNTLDTATADVNDSKDKKKALEGKVQEAEQALKELKPAPKSKPSRASSTKTGSEDSRAAEPAAVDGAWTGRVVVQSSVNPPVTLRKVPRVAEAFPALSSPAVPKTTPSTTWKSLRLVDTPKEEIRGALKKSG